jgi:hypothetical protein
MHQPGRDSAHLVILRHGAICKSRDLHTRTFVSEQGRAEGVRRAIGQFEATLELEAACAEIYDQLTFTQSDGGLRQGGYKAGNWGKGGGQGRNRTTDTRIFNPLLYTKSNLKTVCYSVTALRCAQRVRVRKVLSVRDGERSIFAMPVSCSAVFVCCA